MVLGLKKRNNICMEKTSKIYIAGHRGMVGSALLRALEAKGFTNLILQTSSQLASCC